MGVGQVAGAAGEAGEVGERHAELAVLGLRWGGLGELLGLGGRGLVPGKSGRTRLLLKVIEEVV